jgi:hypothetical protein
VPATVKVATGQSIATFPLSHKLSVSPTSTTISASVGSVTQQAALSLVPFQVVSVSLSPSSLVGGGKSNGSILLNAQPGSSGAITVKLKSSSGAVNVPASVSIAVGKLGGLFTAATSPVASTTAATLTASYGTSSQQATLSVQPAQLIAVSVSPSSVKGSAGTAVTGTVSLNGLAPSGGIVVTLTSSDTSAAKVPTSVTIPAGRATATFRVTHAKVASNTAVTITASAIGQTQTTVLTVTP